MQKVVGAAVPGASGAHAPAAPATLHAWHAAQLALPQQTPSVQWPLMHSPPAAHARPLALSAQLFVAPPPWHVKGATQSPSPVQVARQAFTPHA